MSKATKRKHVTKEILEDYYVPEDGEEIVKVKLCILKLKFLILVLTWLTKSKNCHICLYFFRQIIGGRGNNLHEVQDSIGRQFLVSMPTKFRKNVWVKRGKIHIEFLFVYKWQLSSYAHKGRPCIWALFNTYLFNFQFYHGFWKRGSSINVCLFVCLFIFYHPVECE